LDFRGGNFPREGKVFPRASRAQRRREPLETIEINELGTARRIHAIGPEIAYTNSAELQ
jgi:hypothetical protein